MSLEDEQILDRVFRWMNEAGIDQSKLARELGISPQRVTNWKRRGVPSDMYGKVAAVFNRSTDELTGRVPERTGKGGGQPRPEQALLRIPVIGTVHVGQEGYWKQQQHPVGTGNGYINMPSHDRGAYAIRIVGDTTHSRVRSGEYVVVEPDHPLVAGEEVLIITKDGRCMVRDFLYRREGDIAVQNIRGERLTFPESEVDKIHYVAAITKSAFFSSE